MKPSHFSKDTQESEKTIPIFIIGLEQLIKNKESIKRPKDLEDLKYLLKAKEQAND